MLELNASQPPKQQADDNDIQNSQLRRKQVFQHKVQGCSLAPPSSPYFRVLINTATSPALHIRCLLTGLGR